MTTNEYEQLTNKELITQIIELLTPPEHFMQGWYFGDANHHARPNDDSRYDFYHLDSDSEVITCYCVNGAATKFGYVLPQSVERAASVIFYQPDNQHQLTEAPSSVWVNDKLGHAATLEMLKIALTLEDESDPPTSIITPFSVMITDH